LIRISNLRTTKKHCKEIAVFFIDKIFELFSFLHYEQLLKKASHWAWIFFKNYKYLSLHLESFQNSMYFLKEKM